jgi:hypothetical protein
VKLPYQLTFDGRKYSVHEWLTNLDSIIEECKNNHAQHSDNAANDETVRDKQQALHKHFLENGTEEQEPSCPPPRCKRQRRNSFVIHHDGLGQNFFQAIAQVVREIDDECEVSVGKAVAN